jgi:hypothetical protein
MHLKRGNVTLCRRRGSMTGGFMYVRLRGLIDAVFADPSVEALDVLIAELRQLSNDDIAAAGVIDDLLDYRFALVGAARASTAA